jgi:dihydrolipoamide dehydrogenase
MVVGSLSVETHLAVVGGGPAGCAAACRGAELGIETTLVCSGAPPGATWRGAIAAEEIIRAAAALGGGAGAAAIRRRAREALAARSSALARRLESLGVRVAVGRARFDDSRQLTIEGPGDVPRLRFRRAILATGRGMSVSPDPSGILDDGFSAPRTITVTALGEEDEAAFAAIALARAAALLGHRVTLAMAGAELMPGADEDLALVARPALDRELAAIRLGRASATAGSAGGTAVTFQCGPASGGPEDIGLARTAVARGAGGAVQVDDAQRTADPRILAAGAIAGARAIAEALHHGRSAAETAAGATGSGAPAALPRLIRTSPPIAWCGLTERAAAIAGRAYAVRGAGDGAAGGERVKLLYDSETGIVLGAGAASPRAEEAVGGAILAIEMGAVLDDLAALAAPEDSGAALLADAARARPRRSGPGP